MFYGLTSEQFLKLVLILQMCLEMCINLTGKCTFLYTEVGIGFQESDTKTNYVKGLQGSSSTSAINCINETFTKLSRKKLCYLETSDSYKRSCFRECLNCLVLYIVIENN
jgi:hypothetical protein